MSDYKNFKQCAVIIATHNGAKYLKQQLTSIKQQISVQPIIYYSDDASCDNSIEILEKFKCINLNAEKKTYGSSAANFINAIRKYTPNDYEDYIFLSDQDDVWLPNKMQEAIAALQETQCDAYSGSFYSWDLSKRKIWYTNKYFEQNEVDYLFRSPGPGFTFCLTRVAYMKIQHDLEKHVDKYHNVRWHDWLIYAVARKLGVKWFIDDKPFTLYRLHGDNDTGQITSFRTVANRLKFLLNGDYRKQVKILVDCLHDTRIRLAVNRFNILDRFL